MQKHHWCCKNTNKLSKMHNHHDCRTYTTFLMSHNAQQSSRTLQSS
uniref:Uncharacterized protein n=1 Tax=Arundo donax TaxID=35708 RepID=A0A0A8ZCP6_ARUDO